MEIKEVQVPVPWGHVAVKVWGDEANPPVLVIHGLLDNAGAMDRLIELLPKTFCYYAMDLPGHGRSSHWPEHAVIHTLDVILAYKAVTDYFDRQQYILIGHSWGAQMGILFTLIYPEVVTKIVMLDSLFIFPITSGQFRNSLQELHKQYFSTMEKLKKHKAPEYTREEALDRIMNQRRYGELNQPAAERIIVRNSVETTDGKIRFTTDQRLKFFQNILSDHRYIIDVLKKNPVKCPVLIVLASESQPMLVMYFKAVYNFYKKMPNVIMKEVEGTHDVHNNYPERVADHVCKFLLRDFSKNGRKTTLWSKL